MCLRAQGHISAKLGQIREIKVSMESSEHARPLWAHNVTQAHKLVCMHTIFLRAHTQISANFCQISKIKVSMKYHDYFPYVWAYSRSYEGAGGPKKRPKAFHRGWRAQNSPPQELERGVPGHPDILVFILGGAIRSHTCVAPNSLANPNMSDIVCLHCSVTQNSQIVILYFLI